MPDLSPLETADLFTIGHSNHSPERFLELVRAARLGLIVDVRSQPYSQYADHFNRRRLEAWLSQAGLGYSFQGGRLGGMPEGEEFYDPAGRVLYSRIAATPEFQAGISWLIEEIKKGRLALMCSEEDPNSCHRRRLVGRVLFEQGVRVAHLRGDGAIQTEAELREAEAGANRQLSLFGEEEDEWKSTQSVGPRKAPGISPERAKRE